MEEKKTRRRKKTKVQMSARVNENLLKRIDLYIDAMDRKGITVKKVDIIENALLDYMEKVENEE